MIKNILIILVLVLIILIIKYIWFSDNNKTYFQNTKLSNIYESSSSEASSSEASSSETKNDELYQIKVGNDYQEIYKFKNSLKNKLSNTDIFQSYQPKKVKYNYVINLTRRTDRWKQFLKNKDKTILKEEKFIRFAAFDGFDYENEIKRFGIKNHIIFRFMKEIKLSVSKGVLGCLISHLMLLQEIINNKDIDENDYVGIYEDDIFYCDDFDKKYNQFKKINLSNYNVDFIYLGGRFNKGFDCRYSDDFNFMFEQQHHPNLIKRKQMIYRNFNWDRCTFSFIIRKSICKKLIEIISTSFFKEETEQKEEGGIIKFKEIIKFEAIDYVYTFAFNKINMFDFIPHLYYSPVNYNTDIQGNHLTNIIQF